MQKCRIDQDPYFDCEHSVMKNMLGIVDQAVLDVEESKFVSYRTVEILCDYGIEFNNIDGFCNLHQRMFQDVYAWAGKIRIIDIVKNNSRFCHFMYIERELQRLFTEFRAEKLNDLADEEYLSKLAY